MICTPLSPITCTSEITDSTREATSVQRGQFFRRRGVDGVEPERPAVAEPRGRTAGEHGGHRVLVGRRGQGADRVNALVHAKEMSQACRRANFVT